jgi:DNA polymerase-3 subunit alpha
MAATLTSEMANTDRIMTLMYECRRLGIVVEPPHIDRSGETFEAHGDTIRFGLAAVKGVGRGAVQAIVAARERIGSFTSLDHFCWEVDQGAVNRKTIESLIAAGAFDSISRDRARLTAAAVDVAERTLRRKREHSLGQVSLFGDESTRVAASALPAVAPWTREEILRCEKESLGFYVSGHPLDAVERELRSLVTRTADALDDVEDGQPVVVGGMIVSVKRQFDRKGNTMARLVVEDFTGSFGVLVFSRTFEASAPLIVDDGRVVIRGRASAREGERATVLAEEVRPLDAAFRGMDLHIRLTQQEVDLSLDDLRELLEAHSGSSRVVLHISNPALPGSKPVLIRLKRTLVDPDPKLVGQLKALLGAESVWLANGRPAGVFAHA